MKTAPKISTQHSSSRGTNSENVNLETYGNSNRKGLNGRTYKSLLKSWARIHQKSAGSPQNGDGLSGQGDRVTESDGCAKTTDTAVKRSLSPFEKLRTSCDSEKELSNNNAGLSHKSNSDSHPKDAKDFAARPRIEWVEVEQQSNDKESRDGHSDAEHDKERIACSICALDGELLYCDGKGCNRKFHLSCVDPPFTFAPLGAWHCAWCSQKKIEFGIQSVSNGIGSILDAREVDVDGEVQKQYMVKYKSLAHVHNRWIPERELKERAPSSLARYRKQIHGIWWKPEWAIPHRLLAKRQLRLAKQCDCAFHEYKSKGSNCQNEWLVKWRGLDYDRSTWELENASFLNSPEAAKLMREFECRHKHNASKEVEERRKSRNGMEETPYEGLSGLNSQLDNEIKKLRKCWSRRQSSMVFDNEERFTKVVSFILSSKDNNLPFLVITTCGSLSAWEAEFSRHESSNVVVYNGNNDIRASIRSLEFRNEHGCIMFQVLLSTPVAVIEDLMILEGIKWGGVIADNCQQPIIHNHLKQIKALPTDMRLLIASDHISERRYVYNKLLSFVSCELDEEKENPSDSDNTELEDNISNLKDKLANYIAYECKHQAPRFSEYWVPVELSNVQLEQYCAALLAKSRFLCSSTRKGLSNSLHQLLVLERECCDHPYLVDEDHYLRRSLTKDLPIAERLTAEIEMSGKLQLLEKFLLHIKEQGLRVLIVFQPSVGPGQITVGDVLDDFILHKFGKDSYARIGDRDVIHSKKKAALESFNHRESRQFVFLLEQRACMSSIKLASVDTVILFDSDWNPKNDLKALQKVSLQSQFHHLKIFRLYSIHTVEEKALSLAKQGHALDSLKNISRSICHSLLTWGAYHLFDRLDQFHAQKDSDQSRHLANEQCFLNEVVSEFSVLLTQNTEKSNPDTKIISKVEQKKGAYLKDASLYGEMEAESTSSISLIEKMTQNESITVFWKNLLEQRHPEWKFLSNSANIDQTEQIEKLPEEKQSTEKAVRICRMVNSVPIQFAPVLKRKRSSNGVRKGSSSGPVDCKKPNLQERNDKKVMSKRKRGRPSKTIAEYILKWKKSKSFQNRLYMKGSSSGEETGYANKPISEDVPASEMISSRLTTNQAQIHPPQGSKGELQQVPAHKSLKNSSDQSLGILEERNDKKATSNGKRGRPSKTIADYILKKQKSKSFQNRHDIKGSSLGKESQFGKADKLFIRNLPASEIISSKLTTNQAQIRPPLGSKGELQQVPVDKPSRDSSDKSLDIRTSVNKTEQFPSTQKEILLPCDSQIRNISFEVPHSSLLDPQQRDLEIMEKVIEQAIKIKQDKKSQLRAEFEKEIDQVTGKYVKLIEDAEVELSQKIKELETYYRKVNERKLLVRSVSENSNRAQSAKFPGTPQGAKSCDKISKQSLENSNSTATNKRVKISFASSPKVNPSSSISLSTYRAMSKNSLPHPVISRHLSSPSGFGIRAMAPPHLRQPRVSAEVSPICYSQTQNQKLIKNAILGPGKLSEVSSLSTPVLPQPAVSSSGPLGPTYQPVIGIPTQVQNLRGPSLPAEVSQPCYFQAQNGKTTSKSVSETTSERTPVSPENADEISSLSTSELLSQLFAQMKKT